MRAEKNPKCFTDLDTKLEIAGAIKTLKNSFVHKESTQLLGYATDLEKNLLINKEIIVHLLGESKVQSSSIIKKLNEENKELLFQVKALAKQRSEVQGKLLIAEQQLQDYKIKELSMEKNIRLRVIELLDVLSQKEYAIQVLQQRFNHVVDVLLQEAPRSEKINRLLEYIGEEVDFNKNMHNLMEEKEEFRQLFQKERENVSELKKQLKVLEKENEPRNSFQTKRTPFAPLHNILGPSPTESKQLEELVLLKRQKEQLFAINNKLARALASANKALNRAYLTPRKIPNIVRARHGLFSESPKSSEYSTNKGIIGVESCPFICQDEVENIIYKSDNKEIIHENIFKL